VLLNFVIFYNLPAKPMDTKQQQQLSPQAQFILFDKVQRRRSRWNVDG